MSTLAPQRLAVKEVGTSEPGELDGQQPWGDDRNDADRSKRRVVVADDDVLLREGVAGLLERSGFEIAGQAGDAAELLRVVRDQEPDLVIVDIRMPPNQETEGLDAAGVIRRELPEGGILVLSAHAGVGRDDGWSVTWKSSAASVASEFDDLT
jgi:CheY-like chemotaxis protein